MWRSLDWFGHASIALLALMLVNTVVIIFQSYSRYRSARRQSRSFLRDSSGALLDDNLEEVIAVAARNPSGHVATMVSAALAAFVSVPSGFTHREAIEVCERALQRTRMLVVAELKLGHGTLATIASCAPFIGLVGTVFGIFNAFGGIGMERSAAMARIASHFSEALATTAMGLIVAVPAVWSRNYLRRSIEVFESEISSAALEVITYVSARPLSRNRAEGSIAEPFGLFAGTKPSSSTRSWEAPYDRQRALLAAVGGCAIYILFILSSATYESYLSQLSRDREDSRWEEVGGTELFSPDRRYSAIVPVIRRQNTNSSDKDGYTEWSCSWNPSVALRIVSYDRPLAWKPHFCPEETTYALEQDEAMLTWSCRVPIMMWRTNDELLIQCDGCTTDNMQLVKLDSFPGAIGVLGKDGKRIYPQVVRPSLRCSD